MKQSWQVVWHVVFWAVMISFFAFITYSNTQIGAQRILIIFGLYGLINVGLFYANFLVLIPRYLNSKRYARYIAAILSLMIVVGFAKYGVAVLFKEQVLMHNDMNSPTSFASYYISAFFTSLIFAFLSVVLKFTSDWFLNERIQNDLENQRLSAELAFLKSQINPHFLFNSLNSIYSLAYQKSDTTPEAILKLSEIMRYMLYESNDNKVDLDKELQYLQNYIGLQKIRYGNNAFVDFEVTGEVTSQRIVPLLLIAFIENAFKHGIANDASSPIRISIGLQPGSLFFNITNKKHTYNKDDTGGIGLINVKRRLDLLYPGKYKLDIRNNTHTYVCELILYL